jgi:hypothetical protein
MHKADEACSLRRARKPLRNLEADVAYHVLSASRRSLPFASGRGRNSLEPISKSLEEDNEASELYEAEEILGVVFPTDEDAALPLDPSKEALHEPASHIAA